MRIRGSKKRTRIAHKFSRIFYWIQIRYSPYAMALSFWEILHTLLPINHNFHIFGNEEKDYAKHPLSKFYKFPSVEAKERILYANFLKINKEVKDMISWIQEFNKK